MILTLKKEDVNERGGWKENRILKSKDKYNNLFLLTFNFSFHLFPFQHKNQKTQSKPKISKERKEIKERREEKKGSKEVRKKKE